MSSQCKGLTRSGGQCRNNVRSGGYCWIHCKTHEAGIATETVEEVPVSKRIVDEDTFKRIVEVSLSKAISQKKERRGKLDVFSNLASFFAGAVGEDLVSDFISYVREELDLQHIVPLTPILPTKLATTGSDAASVSPPGLVAIELSSESVSGAMAQVSDGDYIDILITIPAVWVIDRATLDNKAIVIALPIREAGFIEAAIKQQLSVSVRKR